MQPLPRLSLRQKVPSLLTKAALRFHSSPFGFFAVRRLEDSCGFSLWLPVLPSWSDEEEQTERIWIWNKAKAAQRGNLTEVSRDIWKRGSFQAADRRSRNRIKAGIKTLGRLKTRKKKEENKMMREVWHFRLQNKAKKRQCWGCNGTSRLPDKITNISSKRMRRKNNVSTIKKSIYFGCNIGCNV